MTGAPGPSDNAADPEMETLDSARFTREARVGQGGMGAVYRARDTLTGETVALKTLHPLYASDAGYLARFAREVFGWRCLNLYE